MPSKRWTEKEDYALTEMLKRYREKEGQTRVISIEAWSSFAESLNNLYGENRTFNSCMSRMQRLQKTGKKERQSPPVFNQPIVLLNDRSADPPEKEPAPNTDLFELRRTAILARIRKLAKDMKTTADALLELLIDEI